MADETKMVYVDSFFLYEKFQFINGWILFHTSNGFIFKNDQTLF
jgi:hypothetical protein